MSTDTQIEAPLYRVLRDAPINGIVRRAGSIIECENWPSRQLEPVNESAAAIAEFWTKYQAVPGFPRSPYVLQFMTWYLPGALPRSAPPSPVGGIDSHGRRNREGAELPNPVPASAVLPGMPAYRVVERRMAPRGSDGHLWVRRIQQVGQHHLEDPEEVVVLLWFPTADFTPANRPAELVMTYHAANMGNAAMLPSPYCHIRRGVFLPELPSQMARRPVTRGHDVASEASQLPPYAQPGMGKFFRGGGGSGVYTAKPLPDRVKE